MHTLNGSVGFTASLQWWEGVRGPHGCGGHCLVAMTTAMTESDLAMMYRHPVNSDTDITGSVFRDFPTSGSFKCVRFSAEIMFWRQGKRYYRRLFIVGLRYVQTIRLIGLLNRAFITVLLSAPQPCLESNWYMEFWMANVITIYTGLYGMQFIAISLGHPPWLLKVIWVIWSHYGMYEDLMKAEWILGIGEGCPGCIACIMLRALLLFCDIVVYYGITSHFIVWGVQGLVLMLDHQNRKWEIIIPHFPQTVLNCMQLPLFGSLETYIIL